MKMQVDTTLDAGENGCNELIMLIFQKMKTLAPGQTLEVLAYDLAAEIDIPAWCWTTGHLLVSQNIKMHPKRFIIQKCEA
jgi:tRNA 2-thiouridine synthesizing protein A